MKTGTTSRLQITRVSVKGGWLVTLAGILDEALNRHELIDHLSGVVIFDLDQLRRATSFGVREWIRSLHELRADYIGFIKCRPAIVAQFNMVAGFGATGELVSLYAPYLCEACGSTSDMLLDLRNDYGMVSSLALPEVNCSSCGEKTEFDDIPEQYFSHVLSRPAPRTPAVAGAIIDGESSEKVARLHLTKSVDKLVTSFKLRGPLTGSGAGKVFRHAFDGLEGHVLVDLKDVDDIDEKGVRLLQEAARAANSPPLMLSRVDIRRGQTMTPWMDATTHIVSVLVSANCPACAQERMAHAVVPVGPTGPELILSGYCTSCGLLLEVKVDGSAMKLAPTPRQVVSYLRRDDVAVRDTSGDKTGLIAGKYERVRDLGSGGMAEVFLARVRGPEGFNKCVVLKQIQSTLADEAEMIDLFIQEARIAARIIHPNVVQINDLLRSNEQLLIVMEYVSGWNLAQILAELKQRGERMPVGIAAAIITNLCTGLDAAHRTTDEHGQALGIVHQDVSPQNVMISSEGMVKLTDFGVAMVSQSYTQLRRGIISGKPLYMAPEQLVGNEALITRQTDLFSVGMLLYECLFGTLPDAPAGAPWVVDATTLERVLGELPSETADAAAILRRVIVGSLAYEPSERFATAAEIEALLGPLAMWRGKPVTSAVLREWLAEIMGTGSDRPSTASIREPVYEEGDDGATRPVVFPVTGRSK